MLRGETTEKIIKSYYTVYNKLGFGFLEKVYENAMLIELRRIGVYADKQVPIDVLYNEKIVGKYFADIIVNSEVIIELKAAESLRVEDEAQLVNYLKATSVEVGLLLNFGKKPEFKRKIFENKYKDPYKSV